MSGLRIPYYQVDAFTSRVFSGNPAAVCPLKKWLPDEQMQSIAYEANLSNTAFFVPNQNGYDLRWFTPTVEIALCGHATLASAFIIFHDLAPAAKAVRFETKSGPLIVTREDDLYSLDFPARPPAECPECPDLTAALGQQPETVLTARDYVAIYGSEEQVRKLQPDMAAIKQLDCFAIVATAPGKECDFVSRFFAPSQGIPEDPVTGSSHCTLVPYWSKRLHKKKLHARQVSARGGELWCEDRGQRVVLSGKAVRFLEGSIHL